MAQISVDPQDFITVNYTNESYILSAIAAHGDQKYGPYPYSFHLAMVDHILTSYGFIEYKYRASAWLHDVIEDTGANLDSLDKAFGREVTQIVWACTGNGPNRQVKNQDIFNKLTAFPDAAIVKAADRLANVNMGLHTLNFNKLKMYLDEWPEFEKNLGKHIYSRKNRSGIALWVELTTKMEKVGVLMKNTKLISAMAEQAKKAGVSPGP